MNKVIAVLATVLLSVAVSAPAFAQQQMPKGTEGPDVRQQEPKATEGPDVRQKAKKKTASAEAQKPKGTEGPDVRKGKKKSASAEAPPMAGKAGIVEAGVATDEKKAGAAPTESAEAGKVTWLVGTVVAVVPASRTLVVDVPLGKDVLRVGADVTDQTKIKAAGQTVSLDKLEEGARVRIAFRRVEDGDEATSVEVLQGPKG